MWQQTLFSYSGLSLSGNTSTLCDALIKMDLTWIILHTRYSTQSCLVAVCLGIKTIHHVVCVWVLHDIRTGKRIKCNFIYYSILFNKWLDVVIVVWWSLYVAVPNTSKARQLLLLLQWFLCRNVGFGPKISPSFGHMLSLVSVRNTWWQLWGPPYLVL